MYNTFINMIQSMSIDDCCEALKDFAVARHLRFSVTVDLDETGEVEGFFWKAAVDSFGPDDHAYIGINQVGDLPPELIVDASDGIVAWLAGWHNQHQH